MQIKINGENKEITTAAKLEAVVKSIVPDTKGLAVAINNKVVPKTNWAITELQENDKVLLIRATQGG